MIEEKQELESQYGNLSCFDYPKQYDKMEELADEIYTEISFISSSYASDILKVLEEITTQYNLKDISDINIYSFSEYVDTLEFNEETSSLFHFIDIDTRKKYIEMYYVCDNEFIFSTSHTDYIIEVSMS